ncbi:MAG: YraN family protein [Xanthomonadales bacterium]|nr:YraN family protein [Xanthomonadales bacterium]NIN59752.1 YraN family protein [Xanthomonadales bacterium]NIN75521.1 YraN family protein [Xanthomonadales bacterium]NIO15210.1 YraN family protein [Xanthomonadales bacterium]NIP12145.1 YraN family protein [Xanthomonadales bacterium]
MNRRRTGQRWERFAEAYLRRHGLRVVQRNFGCRSGEIDLVLADRGCLVFAEVRYRRRNGFGGPAASVDGRKQRRITRAAAYFLARHREFAARPCRFDVISLSGHAERPRVEWIRNAFDAQQS